MTDWISALFMLVGALFILVAGIGLHRFDDVFARMHAAGKSATFGLGLILIGSAIRLGYGGAIGKLLLVFVLGVVTIPAGVHIIARAAWRAGSELSEGTTLDELSAKRQRDRMTEL